MIPRPPGLHPRLRRAWLGWAAALGALGVALCFVPLFNLLAFEFAFAVGLLATFAAAGLGIRVAQAGEALPNAWLSAGLHSLGLLAVPLVPITLNALRVRNCDYGEGLAFYALLPGVTIWVASGVGVALGAVFQRARLAFWLVFLGSVGLGLLRFWRHPPVDAFNLLLGYWPGAIYDEFIPIGARLVVSRLEDLGWAAALVVGISGLRQGGRAPRWGAGLTLVGAVAVHGLAVRMDIHRDAVHVQAALGGHLQTEHFNIYFDKQTPADAARDLGLELEFDYAELAAWFGVAPSTRIGAYLYPDRATKKRLMGAGRTRVAKPWQRALHVHRAAVGQGVLAHELAHVFSAELVDGPLHIPMHRGVLPHMPLIEGIAEAATWPADRLDLHQWSAAMRAIDVAPPLPAVLAPAGFYLRNSRTAYTLCGSFVRFYGEQHGAPAVNAVYRDGRFPPERFETTHAAWQTMLDEVRLPAAALAHARARFDRPSIFGKVCAHEIAALRKAAAEARGVGQAEQALAYTQAILGHLPGEPRARFARLGLWLALDRLPDALEDATAMAREWPEASTTGRRAREWVADLRCLQGTCSAQAYAALQAGAFVRAEQRRLAAKAAAAARGVTAVIALLTRPSAKAEADQAMQALLGAHPTWGLAHYLAARREAGDDREAALGRLAQALGLGLPHPSLVLEAHRLQARLMFASGEHARAAQAYDALAQRDGLELTQGERSELRRWARRARYFAAQVDTAPRPLEDRAPAGE